LIDYIYRLLDDTSLELPAPPSLPARFAWVYRIDAQVAAGAS